MKIERWGWYSVLVNILLVSLHGVIAVKSGSLAVSAEVIHNLVDLLAAGAVLVAIRLAGRKSRRFPYGLYKVESIVALGMSGLVFLTAYEIAQHALLAPAVKLEAEAWMFFLLLLTMSIPLVFSHYESRAGEAARSPALVADAREYRIHALTTGLTILALTSGWIELPIDRIAALLIVIVVLKTGWEILADAMRVLLDASLDTRTLGQIHNIISSNPLVTEVNWVTGRSAGRYRFIEAGLSLRATELEKVEAAVQRIEASVRDAVPHIERVLVQVEPPSTDTQHFAIPLSAVDGEISPHFGEAPYFLFLNLQRENGTVVDRRVLHNPHVAVERGKGILVAE
jgi:cation diffusion facilitator family transporter